LFAMDAKGAAATDAAALQARQEYLVKPRRDTVRSAASRYGAARCATAASYRCGQAEVTESAHTVAAYAADAAAFAKLTVRGAKHT
jgi:hypothetical protein